MIERPDAGALLAGPLGRWLEGQAEARATASRRMWLWTAIAVMAAAAAVGLGQWQGWPWEVTLLLAVFAFAIPGAYGQIIAQKVRGEVKAKINCAVAEALGVEFNPVAHAGPGFARARQFGLLPSYSDARHEDEWRGEIGATPFALHETRLIRRERDSDGDESERTVFVGCILSLAFTRRFHGTTIVERDSKHRGFFGGQKDRFKLGETEFHRAEMVDPAFEKAFNVWTTDDVEARYLVHPEYVERLAAVEQAFAGKKLRALFHEGELTLVLETGNMFESGSLRAGKDRQMVERTIEQFHSLARLVTRLNERARAGFN